MAHEKRTNFKLDRVSVEGHTEASIEQSPNKQENLSEQTNKKSKRTQHVNSMVHSNSQLSEEALLNALVGSRHTATLTIDGVLSTCLLDSGSQVTTVSETFYKLHLPARQIQSVANLLDIEGAGGQPVPYVGYIEINLTFSKEITGRPEEISTLALIVPDCRSNQEVPVLVGTNVLDMLYETYTSYKENVCYTGQTNCETPPLIQTMYHKLKVDTASGKAGKVKLLSKKCLTIPAGERAVLTGYARNVNITPGAPLLVESLNDSLPGGLMFCNYIMTAPPKASFKVPVLLKNESAHTVKVPAGKVLAELFIPTSVSPLDAAQNRDTKTSQPSKSTATCNKISSTPANSLKFDLIDTPLSEEWKQRITDKLNSMSDVFATHDLDYGHTTAVKHRIRLSDPTPFKQRPRPIHPSDYEAVRQHLKELCDANIIRESESPFASPIVIVKKKNGTIRLCIDYRKLNNQTIKDAYALPNIEEAFSALTGSKWFSVMDLKSGYYQVEVEEEDKPKTAFVTPMGFWEFNRMPQGVTNAPSTFQRVMEKCVGSLNLKEVLVFLDDLIVFSSTLEEHEERLMRVLGRLREFGLKLSPDKCHFFRTSVKYLGHVVSEKGVETDPTKIAALTTWPKPQNVKELKSFLGFSGYYRRFIRDYAKIARPLNDLTVGYYPPRKSNKSYAKHNVGIDPKKPFAEKWTTKCDESFNTLIHKLTTAPILGFADAKKPYIVHTDASIHGLGAALYQEQDNQLRVVAFASRGLSNCEKRYPTHKLEFLALKWAVTDKFFDYLYGAKFTVVTDNNPLTYVLTSAKLDAAGHRWLAALSTFDFQIQYRAGKKNQDADGLSRRPHVPNEADTSGQDEDNCIDNFMSRVNQSTNETVSPEVVHAICQKHSHHPLSQPQSDSSFSGLVECLAVNADVIPPEYSHTDLLLGSCTLPRMSQQDWALEQKKDPSISTVIFLLKAGRKPSFRVRQRESREVQLMLRLWDQLVLRDEVLYRKRTLNGEQFFQLVLPQSYRDLALEGLHDTVGHMGVDRTSDLVRARFYWPRMLTDINTKVQTCERCIRQKARAERSAPLVNIQTNRPLELVCIDYLSLEPDGRGTKNILVITDHFTKYAVAVPTADQKAKTVAKALWNNFFIHYGLPERLHSDQGRDFESALIKELCLLLGIKKTRTTPYHPRGNPVERFNRTLLAMLGTLQEEDKVKWRDFVQPLVHAYNCTKNDTTGYSPYQLMFGRQPNLPIDIAFGLTKTDKKHESHIQYVKELRESLAESYKIATEHSEKSALHNKQRFDKKVRESKLETGDRVLVKNVGLRGKHKIASKWSQTVYKVIKQVKDLPVYVVAPFDSNGPERVLHRDLLLPCGFLPMAEEQIKDNPPKLTRKSKRQQQNNQDKDAETGRMDDVVSDEEYVEYYFYPTDINESEETGEVNDQIENEIQCDTQNNEGETMNSEPEVLPDTVINNTDEPNAHAIDSEPTLNLEAPPFEPQPNQEPTESLTTQNDLNPNIQTNPNNSGSAEILTPQKLRQDSEQDVEIQEPEQICFECEMDKTNEEEDPQIENETVQVRRSNRDKTHPKRLTYPSLGNPLVVVMQSIFNGLDKALQIALETDFYHQVLEPI